MFAKKHLLVGATLTLVATGAASAKEPAPTLQVFRAAADTYVTAARPAANYGRSLSLRAAGAPETTTFLRFELKKPASADATVILLLHAHSGQRTAYQVRRVPHEAWGERRLTFANAPKLSNRYTAGKQKRQGSWNAVDVSAFVAGRAMVSLAVTSRSPKGLVFHSRESKLGPRLVIQTGQNQTDIESLLPLP